LSLILRHKPQVIGLTLDSARWTAVNDLINRVNQYGFPITQGLLDQVVQTQPHLNLGFNADRSSIRVKIQTAASAPINRPSQAPPSNLFHPVGIRFLAAVRTQELVVACPLDYNRDGRSPDVSSLSRRRYRTDSSMGDVSAGLAVLSVE